MKTKTYILFVLAALLTASCSEEKVAEPYSQIGQEAYGNQSLKATNPKTIAQVKAMFSSEISSGSLKQVTEPMQIQGFVVGNDEGGNIYQTLYIQDQTGAIKISISQAGLYGPFPVGQSVLVELNGLYVGGYGQEPQIGTTYTNPKNGTIQTGRMSRYEWQKHYKILSPLNYTISPLVDKWSLNDLDIAEHCCKLVTLKGVELKDADGTNVFAPEDGDVTGGCVNRPIKYFSNMVVRTSTYAKFANKALPTGRVDITGVASRFDDTWQFYLRTDDDIKPTELSPSDLPPVTTATGKGTKAEPYNVIGAFEAVKDLKSDQTTSQDIYIKGYVVKVVASSFSSQYGNINYYISDDPEGKSSCFYIYRGLSFNQSKFTSADALKPGDQVVTCGKITNYNGTIEYASTSTVKNYLISLNGKTK